MRPSHLLARLQGLGAAGLFALPPAPLRALAGRPVVIDGQTLDVEAQLTLRLAALTRVPDVCTLSLEEGRAETRRQALAVSGFQPIGAVEELSLAGVPARRYLPRALVEATGPLPTLVYFHGGGFVFGDLESHDAPCRFLAEKAGVQVLSVDYRLAPEHPFPAAQDDAEAVFRHVVEHASVLAVDVERLAVGGDSAGGNLAAYTALFAARQGLPLTFQLLVYPVTDYVGTTASRELFGEGYYLTTGYIDLCTDAQLPHEGERKDPRASVLLADVPAGLAPAYVVTAGFDPLRDEGEAYARKLADAGVTIELERFPGLIHGFVNIVGAGRSARGAVHEIAIKLKDALA